jgi:hypothetical protein
MPPQVQPQIPLQGHSQSIQAQLLQPQPLPPGVVDEDKSHEEQALIGQEKPREEQAVISQLQQPSSQPEEGAAQQKMKKMLTKVGLKASKDDVKCDKYMLHLDEAKIRKSIGPAKLVFVYGLLKQLLQCAIHCHKLRVKERLLNEALSKAQPGKLRKLFVPSSESHPMEAIKIEKAIQDLKKKLAQNLNSFDVARATVKWLIKDYQLVKGLVKVRENRTRLDDLPQNLGAEALVMEIKKADGEIERQIQAIRDNDRDSIVVGLNFLDKNNSGYIEPSDLPELAADAFNAMDVDKSQKISPAELKRAVSMAVKSVEDQTRKLNSLNAQIQCHQERMQSRTPDDQKQRTKEELETEEATVLRLQMQADRIKAEMDSSKLLFGAVDQFFFGSFSTNVWDRLEETKETQEQFSEIVHAVCSELQAAPLTVGGI